MSDNSSEVPNLASTARNGGESIPEEMLASSHSAKASKIPQTQMGMPPLEHINWVDRGESGERMTSPDLRDTKAGTEGSSGVEDVADYPGRAIGYIAESDHKLIRNNDATFCQTELKPPPAYDDSVEDSKQASVDILAATSDTNSSYVSGNDSINGKSIRSFVCDSSYWSSRDSSEQSDDVDMAMKVNSGDRCSEESNSSGGKREVQNNFSSTKNSLAAASAAEKNRSIYGEKAPAAQSNHAAVLEASASRSLWAVERAVGRKGKLREKLNPHQAFAKAGKIWSRDGTEPSTFNREEIPIKCRPKSSQKYNSYDLDSDTDKETDNEEDASKWDCYHNEPETREVRHTPRKVKRLKKGLSSLARRSQRAMKKLSSSGGTSSSPARSRTAPVMLTVEDIEICQRLDMEYERALEEREVGWTARYNSVRQSACLSLSFMLIYLILGTTFFARHTEWALHESLLFTIYTITTVGYGNHYIPETPSVHAFIIFYILVGIATLTIMVAQVYQCIALEATRAQFFRDKADTRQNGNAPMEASGHIINGNQSPAQRSHSGTHNGSTEVGPTPNMSGNRNLMDFHEHFNSGRAFEQLLDAIVHIFDKTKNFLKYTQIGRGISVLLPFLGLILIGASVVAPIEGWTFIEGLYFSVVSLTTVGFGDYYPTKDASIWFCIFWLPFSVGFMSIYLGSVAHFYITLSNSNIQRMERRARRKITRAKEEAERENQAAYARALAAAGQQLTVESDANDGFSAPQDTPKKSPVKRSRQVGFEALQNGDNDVNKDQRQTNHSKRALFGTPEAQENGLERRERIMLNASPKSKEIPSRSTAYHRPSGQTMTTMKDVLTTVKAHMQRNSQISSNHCDDTESVSSVFVGTEGVLTPEREFLSVKSTQRHQSVGLSQRHRHKKKPSFALRVLVQERIAEIIAAEIAGYQSNVEIRENTLSVTIDSLKTAAEKWMIPRRARKAFRAVAFEALYFVGEHGLITRGPDALYDLTPFEFHGLFGPLLASMGDAESMEGWLEGTNIMADVELSLPIVMKANGRIDFADESMFPSSSSNQSSFQQSSMEMKTWDRSPGGSKKIY